MDLQTRIRALLSAFRTKRFGDLPFVRLDDSGIYQTGPQSPTHLMWHEISDVYAYKMDCFSMDQIRILLGDEVQQKWIEVTEDDDGYQNLINELPRRLPGCLSEKEWWRDVALPPFETQWTHLYKRS